MLTFSCDDANTLFHWSSMHEALIHNWPQTFDGGINFTYPTGTFETADSSIINDLSESLSLLQI